MHFFSVATILFLVASISACSSGSSSEPDAPPSTNTVPANNSTDDNEASGENGETSDNGAGEINEDDPDAASDTNELDNQEEDTPTIPNIDPESDFGQFQNRVTLLTGRTLIALNQKLTQGELLNEQESNCLGAFDPALGEALLAINCAQPLAIGDVPIFTGVAAFEDTPACQTSLLNAAADGCVVDQATLQINTLFSTPETGTPQPEVGATISYNIEQGQLTLENLPEALSGIFQCQYDINTGAANGAQIGDCGSQLTHLVNLIDLHLVAGT